MSFISAIPLKSLNADSTANAIRLFVGILGFTMSKFSSDYGPESSSKFTAQLNSMGITHTSRIPERSQSQGNVAIKILKQTLTKVCASKLTNKEWDIVLPLAVTSINMSNPRGAPLSRLRLMYSPFVFNDQPMILSNPLKAQWQSYDHLNKSRIKAMQGTNIKKHQELKSVRGMNIGMFVTLDSKQGNKSLNICPSLD